MGSLLPSRLGMWRPPLLTILLLGVIHCKRYKRCELAEELRNTHKIVNRNFLANLVCIGHYESGLETDAVGTKGERVAMTMDFFRSPTNTGVRGLGPPLPMCATFPAQLSWM